MTRLASVFVRADASWSIGIGHIRRCAILAAELLRRGMKVVLVTRTGPEGISVDLGWPGAIVRIDEQFPDHVDGEQSDAEQTCSIIEQSGAGQSWIIVDGERFGPRWESCVRRAGHRVMAFDDSQTGRHCADIVVSDSEGLSDDAPLAISDIPRKLYGRQYAIVDERFQPDSNITASTLSEMRAILVTYGGSDPTGETLKAIHAMKLVYRSPELQRRIKHVAVVVGPLNHCAESIVAEAGNAQSIRVYHAPACLAAHMAAADIVLTAGGNSLIEALAMCKPCLATVTAENQQHTVSGLVRENAVRCLGWHREVTAEQIADAISDLLEHYDERAQLLTEKPFYDHHGATRIADAIVSCSAGAVVRCAATSGV